MSIIKLFWCPTCGNRKNKTNTFNQNCLQFRRTTKKYHIKRENIMSPLYKLKACPHLEYFVQVWPPHLIMDIEEVEKVHRGQKGY